MAFTAESLATFMSVQLGPTGVALGLTAASDAIVDAVAELEAVLGVVVADVGDDLKTRIVGRWIAWRTALGAATGNIDLGAGSAKLADSQTFDHILIMLRDAADAASVYPEVAAVIAGSNVAVVSGISAAGSPYGWSCPGSW